MNYCLTETKFMLFSVPSCWLDLISEDYGDKCTCHYFLLSFLVCNINVVFRKLSMFYHLFPGHMTKCLFVIVMITFSFDFASVGHMA